MGQCTTVRIRTFEYTYTYGYSSVRLYTVGTVPPVGGESIPVEPLELLPWGTTVRGQPQLLQPHPGLAASFKGTVSLCIQ